MCFSGHCRPVKTTIGLKYTRGRVCFSGLLEPSDARRKLKRKARQTNRELSIEQEESLTQKLKFQFMDIRDALVDR